MSMVAITFLLAAATYECRLDKGIAAAKGTSAWEIFPMDNPKSIAGVEFSGFSVFLDGAVLEKATVTSKEKTLHLNGTFPILRVSPNHVSWNALSVGDCVILDAKCAPSVQLYDLNDTSAVSVISLATFGAMGGGVQTLVNVNFMLTCTKIVAGAIK